MGRVRLSILYTELMEGLFIFKEITDCLNLVLKSNATYYSYNDKLHVKTQDNSF